MARRKVKLACIENNSTRRATFRIRKKGLMKKVSELTTLCGIDACVIVFSPYESQPDVWPSPPEAQRIISLFKRMPEFDQSKNMVNQETFLKQRIIKTTEQLKKQKKDNRENGITRIMFHILSGKMNLNGMSMIELNDLELVVDHYLSDVVRRIDSINKTAQQNQAQVETTIVAGAREGMMESNVQDNNQIVERRQGEVDPNMEAMNIQPWMFMEMMNQNDHMNFGLEEMFLPYVDNNPNNSLLPNNFSP